MSVSRSHAPRPLLFLVMVLATICVFDRIGAWGLRALLLQSDYRIAHIYRGGMREQVLITGGSVANAMADPIVLTQEARRAVFMMALHGLDARTQEALLLDYVERNGQPALVLLEARVTRTRLVRAPEISLFAPEHSHVGVLIGEEARSPLSRAFELSRLNSPLLPLAVQRLIDRDDQATGASNGSMTPAIVSAWRQHSEFGRFDPTQVEAYVRTLRALRARGIAAVVIYAPLFVEGREQAGVLRRELEHRLPPATIVCDFSDLIAEEESFEDPAHLNARGRAIFEPYLAALVSVAPRADAVLPPRCRRTQ